ncbi:MAG: ureidoglycolate dehydrogenase [Cohnella sp.]|nr:ureidoglycolate dehydrogenase [Cohnella sp.]
METVIVRHKELQRLCEDKFIAAGVPEEEAKIASSVLVHADLRGVESHGVMRMEHYITKIGQLGINPTAVIQARETGPVTAMVDGDDSLGHVVAYRSMENAIRLAKTNGVGMVGAYNSSHCGALSYFVRMAAQQNLIGIAMTNSDSAVVPFGGRQMFFGTNPIAYGFPAGRHEPIILDMATSAVAFGKVFVARDAGKTIPPDWGVDREGRPTTDPSQVKAMLPFGGAKGYGLSMVVDIFSSLLMGLAFGPHVNVMYGDDLSEKRKLGHYFCAVDVSRFSSVDHFREQMDQMIDELHAAPPAEGFDRVLVPGEPEALSEARRLQEGIPVPIQVCRYLQG